MALFGVVFALGAGSAAAQTVNRVTYSGNKVTVAMSSPVRVSSAIATDLPFSAFTITGNLATNHAVSIAAVGGSGFVVFFTNTLAGIGTQMTYTAPTTGARIVNATSGTAVSTFTATVLPATPYLPLIPDQSVQVGLPASITLPVAVGGTGPLSYSIATATPLPVGLSFDGPTQTITGTTTAPAGRRLITYKVTDGTNSNSGDFFLDLVVPPALSVTVNAAPMTIAEGGTSTITAMANRMVAAADGAVTVSLGVVGEATLSASSITIAAGFQSGNVTLISTPDTNYVDDTVTVVATGAGITGSLNVMIAVTDPAPAAALSVTVSAAPTTIAEGGTSTITAMANRMVAAADGAVTVSLGVVGEATLSASSITIAAGFQSGGNVTLTSTPDTDYVDDTVTVVATGAGITGSLNVMIAVTDPAPAAALSVTVSAAPTTIAEGGTSVITAMANRMVAAADGAVTVNLSVVGGATLSPNSITIAAGFQSGNVTLTATEDADYVDETVTVTASGAGITGNQQIAITVTDNDTEPVPATVRGQITEFKLIGEVSEKTIGGVPRLFVDEGEQNVKLSVTVQWTHEEIAQIGYDTEQWVFVVIKENRKGGPPSGAGNWLSWIDVEGDVHFPQFSRGNSGWGNLGGWVVVKTPKASAIPVALRGSPRHAKSMTGELPVLVLHDNHEAENDAFYIEAENASFSDVDLNATAAVNKITPEVVIDDDEEQKVTIKGPTTIYESAGTAEFTLGADPQRVELPLDVALQMLYLEGGTTVSAAQISVSDASVEIGTGASAPKVTVHLPASDGNREDNDYQMQASVNLYSLASGGFDTIQMKSAPIKVVDVHKLPWLTVSPASGAVAEGGTLELTLNVNRNPANTIATDPEKVAYTSEALTIAVKAGGDASSSDFTMTPSSISVDEYKHTAAKNWMQPVKVTIAASADEDIDAETLMLDFVVNGTKAENGPRPDGDTKSVAQANLTIQDATETLVSVRENAYDVIKGALGDPPMLTTGMSAELMGVNLFDYDSAAVSVAYATSVEGGAVTASASGGMVTLTGAMAGDAKVTITATATPTSSSLVVNQTKANVAQMTFPVMVEDEDLVYRVAGPDDMNLTEGGMGGRVTITTNRPVTANTEVMLMRDGSSSASDDDYSLTPPMVTIMAGDMSGSVMVMATDDGMAEEKEMLTLFLVVDGMQMTDKSVSFYLWDAAVPALPLIAQLLLAAFLALGGYRRYLRR